MKGRAQVVKGRLEEAAGALVGNEKWRDKGQTDQAVGHVRQAGEKGVRQVKALAQKLVDQVKSAAGKAVDTDNRKD